MSVMMIMRVPGDTGRMRSFLESEGERLSEISEEAKSKGCLHHRFAIGDGHVFVIDEWESQEAFQGFFEGNEAIAQVMAQSGAQGEPEITFADAVDSADMF